MTDILGQALQKITSPDSVAMAGEPQVPPVVAVAEVRLPDSPTIEEGPGDVPAEASESKPMTPALMMRGIGLRLQGHRRQAAAVVVAVCIAVYWLEGGSSSVSVDSSHRDAAQSDVGEEELMLDEFDAIQISPMREPAEPLEVAAMDPFPLTIPQMESDASQTQVADQGSGHPLLNQRIGDVRNQSAVQAESNGSLESPSQRSSDNSPPSNPRSVRFTGRIQPLN